MTAVIDYAQDWNVAHAPINEIDVRFDNADIELGDTYGRIVRVADFDLWFRSRFGTLARPTAAVSPERA